MKFDRQRNLKTKSEVKSLWPYDFEFKVGKSPSPFIANVLQDLPWMCQNYKTGCQEIKMNVEDLEHHQRKCIYRQVFCPQPDKNCQSKEILFKDVIEHLETSHKVHDFGETNQLFGCFGTGKHSLKEDHCSALGKFATSCGAVFFTSAKVAEKRFCVLLTFIGSSDEAENYSSSVSIEAKIGKKFNKFNFTGSVHTIDEKADDIISSGSLLSIGLDAAKRSLNEEKVLKFKITIRNLKEEAKDEDIESGVSDGE